MEILKRLMLIAMLAVVVWLAIDFKTASKMNVKKFSLLAVLLVGIFIIYVVVFKVPLKW